MVGYLGSLSSAVAAVAVLLCLSSPVWAVCPLVPGGGGGSTLLGLGLAGSACADEPVDVCGGCYPAVVAAVTKLPGLEGMTITNGVIKECGALVLQDALDNGLVAASLTPALLDTCQAGTTAGAACPAVDVASLAAFDDVTGFCAPAAEEESAGLVCGACRGAAQRAVLEIPGVSADSTAQLEACGKVVKAALDAAAPANTAGTCFVDPLFSLAAPTVPPKQPVYPGCPGLVTSTEGQPYPDPSPAADDLADVCNTAGADVCGACLSTLFSVVTSTPGLSGGGLSTQEIYSCAKVIIDKYEVPYAGLTVAAADAVLKCQTAAPTPGAAVCPAGVVAAVVADLSGAEGGCTDAGQLQGSADTFCQQCASVFSSTFFQAQGLELANSALVNDCYSKAVDAYAATLPAETQAAASGCLSKGVNLTAAPVPSSPPPPAPAPLLPPNSPPPILRSSPPPPLLTTPPPVLAPTAAPPLPLAPAPVIARTLAPTLAPTLPPTLAPTLPPTLPPTPSAAPPLPPTPPSAPPTASPPDLAPKAAPGPAGLEGVSPPPPVRGPPPSPGIALRLHNRLTDLTLISVCLALVIVLS